MEVIEAVSPGFPTGHTPPPPGGGSAGRAFHRAPPYPADTKVSEMTVVAPPALRTDHRSLCGGHGGEGPLGDHEGTWEEGVGGAGQVHHHPHEPLDQVVGHQPPGPPGAWWRAPPPGPGMNAFAGRQFRKVQMGVSFRWARGRESSGNGGRGERRPLLRRHHPPVPIQSHTMPATTRRPMRAARATGTGLFCRRRGEEITELGSLLGGGWGCPC